MEMTNPQDESQPAKWLKMWIVKKELGHDSRRITTCAIANMLRISLESQEQKEYQMNTCQDLQEGLERDLEFFSKTGTGDVTWIERYDPQIKPL